MKYGWLIAAALIVAAFFILRNTQVKGVESRTVDTVYVEKAMSLNDVPGKIDTVYKKVPSVVRKDTVYIDRPVVIASVDTTLQDSSRIQVAYNITDNLFDIKAKIKERVVKEVVTKTEFRAGKIFLTGGIGYIHNGTTGDVGVFIGVGYAIPIW